MLPPSAAGETPRLVLRDGSRGLFRQRQTFAAPISVLMIFLGVVLLLACANIATLLLARGARRHREMSVRVALGASRGQLARQVLVESLLLAVAGGAIGLSIALVVPPPVPARFDANVFVFTALITMFTGVVFGVGPALAESRADLNEGMKRGRGAGKALVGFQIALSTLLVIAAGLFIRSLAGLNAVNPGFHTDHLLLAQIVLPQNRYGAGANVAFHQRLERAIADLPGVTSVGPAEVAYLSGDMLTTNVWRQGEAIDPNRPHPEAYNAVMSTYKNPIMGLGEAGLVAAVVFHALNGIRIMLVDFWSKGTRYQRPMVWIVLGLWVVLMVPFLIRHLGNVFGG